MPELTVRTADGERRIAFQGTPFLSALLGGLPDAPSAECGGKGVCGRCAVYASGALSPAPDASGRALACRTRVTGDAEIVLRPRRVITQIETDASVVEPEGAMPGRYGVAADIGTTTLALRLIDLLDGAPLATVSAENPQRALATDVIGRIGRAMEGDLNRLRHMIADALDEIEKTAFMQAGAGAARADRRVLTGNTAMLYLFAGRDPSCLSRAPFRADCLFDCFLGRDYLPPCAAAFIGADILCALLDSRMTTRDETALLIDLGTNGEIALWHRGKLTVCAAAAGPAFEGGGIECGAGSVKGAIDKAWLTDGKLCFSTIGGAPACGICGSGLIDLTACLMQTGELDETGALEKTVDLARGVYLCQKDIRQVQLAKGAVAAGIETLLRRAELTAGQVEKLYIAGGFGRHLNLDSAAEIGLIPGALTKRTRVIGNAALGGAQRILLRRDAREEIAALAARAECVNLGGDPVFNEAFVEQMLFHPQAARDITARETGV